jgi:hypothetical protein
MHNPITDYSRLMQGYRVANPIRFSRSLDILLEHLQADGTDYIPSPSSHAKM